MTCLSEFADDLRTHRNLCEDILSLVQGENARLSEEVEKRPAFDVTAAKKKFLAQLAESLNKIREHRISWLKLEPTLRQGYPEITELLRENQNLIMKILVLDRDNEQAMLRKGLVPARHVPAASRQRPHFVSSIYQRHSAV